MRNVNYIVIIFSSLLVSIACFVIKIIFVALISSPTEYFIFEFDIIKNKGLIMGWISNYPMLVKAIMVGFLVLFCYMLYKSSRMYHQIPRLYIVAPWLLVTGLTGNMADMLINGYVTDYISIRQPWIEPFFFNIDDVLIQLGAILFTFQVIFSNSTLDKIYKRK